MNIWNTICKDILEKRAKQATEKDYHELVYTHFKYLLGWHCEHIENQFQLRVGSVSTYFADMVFFKNNEPVFVIEMKEPNHTQSKKGLEQLYSYIKLLPVQFGIYIGEHIELFYYEFGKEPISVLKVEFTINSDNGKKFIELFKQENFSIEQLTEFCKAQIYKQEKEKEIHNFINELTTEKGKELLTELLTNKLLHDGYSTENVAKITDEIEINIQRKNHTSTLHIEKRNLTLTPVIHKKNRKDYTHYRLNGAGNFGKGRLALAVVKLFVENNPHLTFYEIKNKIPFGIEEYSAIQKWKETTPDKSKDNRYHEKKENLMISADGITFAFTREIGSGNIGEIIKFGEEQGYTIEPII